MGTMFDEETSNKSFMSIHKTILFDMVPAFDWKKASNSGDLFLVGAIAENRGIYSPDCV